MRNTFLFSGTVQEVCGSRAVECSLAQLLMKEPIATNPLTIKLVAGLCYVTTMLLVATGS